MSSVKWRPFCLGLNVLKMSYPYVDFHNEDKMVSQLCYIYNGNPFTWNDDLYIETPPPKKKPWNEQCHWFIYVDLICCFSAEPIFHLVLGHVRKISVNERTPRDISRSN